jgi:hypothetical protein
MLFLFVHLGLLHVHPDNQEDQGLDGAEEECAAAHCAEVVFAKDPLEDERDEHES